MNILSWFFLFEKNILKNLIKAINLLSGIKTIQTFRKSQPRKQKQAVYWRPWISSIGLPTFAKLFIIGYQIFTMVLDQFQLRLEQSMLSAPFSPSKNVWKPFQPNSNSKPLTWISWNPFPRFVVLFFLLSHCMCALICASMVYAVHGS